MLDNRVIRLIQIGLQLIGGVVQMIGLKWHKTLLAKQKCLLQFSPFPRMVLWAFFSGIVKSFGKELQHAFSCEFNRHDFIVSIVHHFSWFFFFSLQILYVIHLHKWNETYHFLNKPWFLRVCRTSLLKTLREKEKLLVTSNSPLCPSVFNPYWRFFLPLSSNLKLSSANSFSSEESEICCLGKG